MNINKWLLLSVFFNLQINCAESKEEKKAAEQKIEVEEKEAKLVANPKEAEDKLKGILESGGIYEVLQKEVLDYLRGYKCFKKFNESARTIVSLPNGNLVVGRQDGTISIVDGKNFNYVAILNDNANSSVTSLLIFNYGTGCASGHRDGSVRIWDIWDINTNKCLFLNKCLLLKGHTDDVREICMSSSNNLVTASQDGSVKVWNIVNGNCLRTFKFRYVLSGLYTLPNDNLLLVSGGGEIKTLNIKTGKSFELVKSEEHIWGSCLLPNDNLACQIWDSTIEIWDLKSKKLVTKFISDTGFNSTLSALPNNKLVYGSDDGSIRIWDINTGRCLQKLEDNSYVKISLCVLPDGNFASTDGQTVCIWQNDLLDIEF